MSRCEKSEAAITGKVSPIPFALRLRIRIRYKGATQPDVFCGSGSRERVRKAMGPDTCLLR
jgi:hypothetical protein